MSSAPVQEHRLADSEAWLDARLRQRLDTRLRQLCLVVSIGAQRLYRIAQHKVDQVYLISSSRFGLGNQQDSYQTPLGLHCVAAKHGDGLPMHSVLVGRQPTGAQALPTTTGKADVITTRILRLRGLEAGKNSGYRRDSFHRLIYIHGTPYESAIGRPASSGCIRMRNRDILELYPQVSVGALVLICA